MFAGMVGRGSARVLAVTSNDPVLSLLAPIGLAASAGTALVVDLAGGLHVPSARTLADIAAEGPRLDELSPGRAGVAFVTSGSITLGEAGEMVDQLATRWPAVVVRSDGDGWPGPTVPVRALYPGWLAPSAESAAVWQPMAHGSRPPGPGPVLPRVGRGTVRRLLSGRLPSRSRWVRAWKQVWGMPWA